MATGLFAAIFACVGHSTTAFADTAYRTANGLQYQGKSFTKQVTITKSDPRKLTTSADVYAYEYSDPTNNSVQDIYFVSKAAAQTATTALYAAFTLTPPNSYNQTAGPTTLTISNNPPPGGAAPTPSAANAGNTCNVSGIGWIICPVTSQLASMIDGIYGVLMQFLDVQPMLQNSPVFDVWNAVKNIANICFVLVFMVIIFSQVTSFGLSNYGLKKMIPRLIIAAILVNISYWICAIGVDLSNFLGHSVYAFLMSFAQSLNMFKVDISWGGLAQGILGGTAAGGIVVGAGMVSLATAGSLAAALFTLLGMLISVALAAVTALFILMARQALLVIFVIVSPLAFVALVLPKTEKWFDKWKDTFLAMLIMFPLFSLVFGGAVLAGAAIIVGANNNIFLILLGKGTQLMPLAITPLLVKFSSGALGTVASFASNKNKGLTDRARNWTKNQSDYHRKKSLANPNNRRFNAARWTAQRFDDAERRQKVALAGFEDASETRARNGGTGPFSQRRLRAYRKAYNYAQDMSAEKQTEDNILKGGYDRMRRTDARTTAREVRRRETEVAAKFEAESLETMHAEIAAQGAQHATMQQLSQQLNAKARAAMLANASSIKLNTENIAFDGIAKKMAERVQQDNVATILEKQSRTVHGVDVRKYAGGIQGEQGEHAALAYAVALQRKQYAESVSEMNELIKHYAPDSGDIQNMILGKDSKGNAVTHAVGVRRDKSGKVVSTFNFDRTDSYAMEAAIDNNMTIGTVPMVEDIIKLSGSELSEYRTTISAALAKSSMGAKSIYLGGRLINEIAQGNIASAADLENYLQAQITEGKFSAQQLATADAPALTSFLKGAQDKLRDPGITADERNRIGQLAKKAYDALTDPQIKSSVKDNAKLELLKITKLNPSLPPIDPKDL